MPRSKQKTLGIDYGMKRIGLAVSDELKSLAFGRGIIENTGFSDVGRKISELCDKEKVNEVVVGLPLGLNGKETKQTVLTRKFIEKLEAVLDIPVFTQDERLSTVESSKILSRLGIKARDQKNEKDELSAILILQTFLDSRG